MADCPRCDADIEIKWGSHGACLSCGLLYIVEQQGDTWSGDEFPIAVWETDADAVKAAYGVTDADFERIKKESNNE